MTEKKTMSDCVLQQDRNSDIGTNESKNLWRWVCLKQRCANTQLSAVLPLWIKY